MLIKAKKLSKVYGSGENQVVALDKVDLTVAPGDFISIIGPSGSGKSTGSSLGMSVLTEKADLLNVLDYVKGLDYVDPTRITLAGCSQGGLVSALAAAEREAEVERLVL